jgi:hypothetical protein
MSSQSNKPFGQGTAVVSLVAALTCACAGNALASRPATAPDTGEAELSARVASLVKRLQAIEPALVRELPALKNIAQWRNR